MWAINDSVIAQHHDERPLRRGDALNMAFGLQAAQQGRDAAGRAQTDRAREIAVADLDGRASRRVVLQHLVDPPNGREVGIKGRRRLRL